MPRCKWPRGPRVQRMRAAETPGARAPTYYACLPCVRGEVSPFELEKKAANLGPSCTPGVPYFGPPIWMPGGCMGVTSIRRTPPAGKDGICHDNYLLKLPIDFNEINCTCFLYYSKNYLNDGNNFCQRDTLVIILFSKWLWGSSILLYFLDIAIFSQKKKYSVRIYDFQGICTLELIFFCLAHHEICWLLQRASSSIQNFSFE